MRGGERMFEQFLTDESGQSMVEYSLIFALVVLGAFGAFGALKGAVIAMYSLITDKFAVVFF